MLAGGTIVDWDDFGDAGQLFVLDDEYDLSTVIAVPVPVSASGSFGGIDVPSPPTEYLLPAGWLEVFGLTVSDSNANYWIDQRPGRCPGGGAGPRRMAGTGE